MNLPYFLFSSSCVLGAEYFFGGFLFVCFHFSFEAKFISEQNLPFLCWLQFTELIPWNKVWAMLYVKL